LAICENLQGNREISSILNPKRRPKVYLTEEQKKTLKQAYSESSFGVRMLRHRIIKRYKQKKRKLWKRKEFM
jgi:hypothetical protein